MAAPRYLLGTFGTLTLIGPGNVTVLGQHGHHRRRLALLAVLAAAGERGRTRDQLLVLVWPEAAQARARRSLDQLLYELRSTIASVLDIAIDNSVSSFKPGWVSSMSTSRDNSLTSRRNPSLSRPTS